jgi:hypothetical protein
MRGNMSRMYRIVSAAMAKRTFQASGLIAALLIGAAAKAQTSAGADPRVDDLAGRVAVLEKKLQESEKQLQVRSDQLQSALDRLERLESRMAAAGGGAATTAAGAPTPPGNLETQPLTPAAPAAPQPAALAQATPPQETAPPAAPADEESHDYMMAIPHGPVLHLRGFFDFNFDDGAVAQNLQYPLGVPAHSSFRAGEFDLFMTSQLQEKLSFLTELVVATDQTNAFGVDLERFQLTYRPSKYFEISAGRYHTDIGYYNTAFHHGTWFSTATGRPFMYYWEDSGGVLPVHEVGVTTTGLVPGSGKFNVHWTAEIGNGSAELGSPLFGDGVESFASDRNRKDLNFAVYSRPEWFDGLQLGGSILHGDLIPSGGIIPPVNQTISSAYVVFINSKWEFMNEAVLLQHQISDGGRSYNSPLGYTQLSYRFGKYRPYFRFQEVNIPNNDPVTAFKGRYEGPSLGVRMDFFTYAALKLQYNRVYLRDAAAQNGVEVQTAFTF